MSDRPGGDNEVMVEMNTTPLIDVMLVLLVDASSLRFPFRPTAVKLKHAQSERQAADRAAGRSYAG